MLYYIEEILRASPRPLSTREILELLEENNQGPSGKNPLSSINARLSESIKNDTEHSTSMRTGPGIYTLRKFTQFAEYFPTPKEKQYSSKFEEQVLAFPTREFYMLGYFHGIRTDVKDFLPHFLGIKNRKIKFKWLKRRYAEEDNYHKQLVVYVIVKHMNMVVRFRRGKGTSLRNNLGTFTIGIGGHVEYRDQDIFINPRTDAYAHACLKSVKREVLEEIGVDVDKNLKELKAIGVINDDSVEQGKQHFALVFLLELSYPEVHKTEKWIVKPEFIPIESLADDFNKYEYWSQLCIQAFWGKKLKIECQIVPNQNFILKDQSEIILFVGYIGSGKSKACELLEREFGYINVRCSKIMAEIIGCESIDEINRNNLQEAGYSFIHNDNGHNKLAQGIIDFMSNNPGCCYVIDGLRYPETYSALVEKLKRPITIIYIDTLIENLWKYYNGRYHIPMTFNEYLNIISHPVEKTVQRFRSIADIVIHNNGSLESYLSTLSKFIKDEIR